MPASATYRTDPGREDADDVRLLLNDIDMDAPVFTDAEIDAFLWMERGQVKLAAAQAIDTNADNELLASKVLTSQDWQTDGSKVSAQLHARAQDLRAQHAADLEDSDPGFFTVVDTVPAGVFGAPGVWV